MTEVTDRTARLLGMARTAELAGNRQEAIDYYNRVLEDDPTVSAAWLGKGRSAGWASTLANVRVNESIVAFSHAIACASDGEREATIAQAVGDVTEISAAVHSLAWKHFRDFAHTDGAWGKCVDTEAKLIDALHTAHEWAPGDRRPLDLTVEICRTVLDQGVAPGFEDFLRTRLKSSVGKLQEIDPAYEGPALATVTVAQQIQAKNDSDALGYVFLFVVVIVGAILTAVSRH